METHGRKTTLQSAARKRKKWMDQNLGRAALNLLPQAGEFLFENLAARPFPQRAYIKNISFIMTRPDVSSL
jgi:hypothetical protein